MKNHKCDDPKHCSKCFANDYIKYGSSGRAGGITATDTNVETKQDWKDRFDEKFVIKKRLDCGKITSFKYGLIDQLNLVKKLKQFISQEIDKAYIEGYQDANGKAGKEE